jgi:TPR repeat protein
VLVVDRGSADGGYEDMSAIWNHRGTAPGGFAAGAALAESSPDDLLIATCMAAASQGDIEATYTLGVAYSTGSHGVTCDLIEAHKWFNLAAVKGHTEAQMCRADISDEMNAREIAEAQRRARGWIAQTTRRAA